MPVRIGLVSLGEAANFGDDLILIAAAQAIRSACPDADIHHISFGYPVAWEAAGEQFRTNNRPLPRRPCRDLPGSRHDELLLRDCAAIVFGGGGLLETSHHPYRPYHWLRFLPPDPAIPVIAVGLGIGPLAASWRRHLRRMGCPFDRCYLRDDDSLEYAQTRLSWPAARCHDFVDIPFLAQFGPTPGAPVNRSDKTLGVALRQWPGLAPDVLGKHIERIADIWAVDHVRFFVLEARGGQSADVSFTKAVMAELGHRNVTMRMYEGEQLADFIHDMAGCVSAISMKLHSSAVWAALNTPMYPIYYAPKVAAFFGRRYVGLEISEEVMSPTPEDSSVPRAAEVLEQWLNVALRGGIPRRRSLLSRTDRLKWQTGSVCINVTRKLKGSF